MDESQRAYTRIIYGQKSSLLISIPSQIARRLDLKAGQSILVGESEGKIIIKPMDAKLAKKDLKVDVTDKALTGNRPASKQETKSEYENPLDDPDFNPLEKLRIK